MRQRAVGMAAATRSRRRLLAAALAAAGVGSLTVALWLSLMPPRWAQVGAVLDLLATRYWGPALLVLLAGMLMVTAGGLVGKGPAGRRRPAGPPPLSLPVHVALLLIVGALTAAGVGALLWRIFGHGSLATTVPAPSPGGSAVPGGGWTTQITFDAIKIVLAVVGGIGGVVALTVAYRRQHLGEAAERREESREGREQAKLYSDRFAKAAELLGSDKAAVRLAAVYALAALADDWTAGRQTCIDVLCAYLRMPYIAPEKADPEPSAPAGADTLPGRVRSRLRRSAPRPVLSGQAPDNRPRLEQRQVRLTVIRLIRDHLRLPVDHGDSWQGRHFDFNGAVFDGGDFGGAIFSAGTVDFTNATFTGGTVDFTGAAFSGGAVKFRGATFRGGGIDFSGAIFSHGQVDLDATFSGATVHFTNAIFSGASVYFAQARISRSWLIFSAATFAGGTVSFRNATFTDSEVQFWFATFSGGRVDFSDTRFSVEPARPERSLLREATVDFSSAKFVDGTVDFTGAELSGATVEFRVATFTGGTVDLSAVNNWTNSPAHDSWDSGPPAGLLLPPSGAGR